MKYHKNTIGAFTLIETIVSVSLLALAIVGPLTLAANSLRASREARYQLEATQLASEAVEVIHNMRDNNSAQDSDQLRAGWLSLESKIDPNCSSNCVIDVTGHESGVWGPSALIACPLGNCDGLDIVYQHPTSGLMRQSTSALGSPWRKTIYRRTVSIEEIGGGQQMRVTATVTYVGYGGAIRSVVNQQDLYNWFPLLNI